jgi:hypothetical protein
MSKIFLRFRLGLVAVKLRALHHLQILLQPKTSTRFPARYLT